MARMQRANGDKDLLEKANVLVERIRQVLAGHVERTPRVAADAARRVARPAA